MYSRVSAVGERSTAYDASIGHNSLAPAPSPPPAPRSGIVGGYYNPRAGSNVSVPPPAPRPPQFNPPKSV